MAKPHCTRVATICFVFIALLSAGCSARIIPPTAPPRPQTVLVTDYGRHSSLILPDESGHLVEYTYGDWNFFALSETHWYNALQALFFSRGATIGVRHFDFGTDADQLTQRIGCVTLLRISVDSPNIQLLRQQLTQRVDEHRSTRIYNPINDCEFVRDDECYSLWNNCNHLTARWLVALGCEIEGDPVTSKFTLQAAP